ncbi:MAG: SDR family NAD(P)-dependent oxidoreductase, partial [Omnitrophica WOR_2 bacterium]
MIDLQLDRRVVLITGANHGIGAATARLFAEQGARVFVSYYRVLCSYTKEEQKQAREAGIPGERLYRAMQQQPIEPLLIDMREKHVTCAGLELDLSNPENIPILFDRCEAELGPVDILVNNHTHCVLETFDPGMVTDKGFSVQLTSAAGIDAHFAVNTRS